MGSPPADWLHDVLLAEAHREAFFALVDAEGLVVVKNVPSSHPSYRHVRGRSSPGRLSQGEYYHHDGCSGPVKPRIVEIRFPHQPTPRHVCTAVAPFPESVIAMVAELPPALRAHADLGPWHPRMADPASLDREAWDTLQGVVTRLVRRNLEAEAARAYFRAVDVCAGAYVLPWEQGESRFIANNNAFHTMQHRRAYMEPVGSGRPSGSLVKRWPGEELPLACLLS